MANDFRPNVDDFQRMAAEHLQVDGGPVTSMEEKREVSLEEVQRQISAGNSAAALELLSRHFLPSDDLYVTVVYADALRAGGRLAEAVVEYRKAALLGGKHTLVLWRRIFECQFELQDIDAAIVSLRKALSLDPAPLDLHQYAAQLLFSSTLHFQASCHARHILEQSANDDTLAIAENVYRFSMQTYEAYQVVKRRQACSPNPDLYLGLVLCGAQGILEWDTVRKCADILDNQYYAKGDFRTAREIPLYNIARLADEAVNLAVAQAATHALEQVEPAFDLRDRLGKPERPRKIRVGLLSADFSSHPVIQLIIGLFENMDKSRFELFAFDDGKNDPNGETRMLQAMDRHIDVREQSDRAVAQKVYEEKIDILIDLMGLTTKNRQGVLALRPCPVTAVFLGFPGTCGLSKIDYVITDPTITPDSSKPYYAEKLCRLPEVFMPNDNQRLIADNPVTRAAVGLPEDALVFCSFNRSFKLDEESVNLWMRILARVPNSVLWQKADEAHLKKVFLETAAKHGVAPERIIFAGNTSSVALHLARAGLADLGLDTLIYNGHTITSDLLWAGVPVLTCRGKHFASRVSASLLQAVGLDECVAETVRDMEDLAVALATNPARRRELRARLAANKLFMPLYDTERYTRHFETALAMMLERAQAGLAPDHIDVPALPPRSRADAFRPDGPPRVFEERAGTPEGGAYADMAVDQSHQKTPYGIHFGACPLCETRAAGAGIPVRAAGHPHWRAPLPEKIFWLQCPACGHLHANCFWDDAGLKALRSALAEVAPEPERFMEARARLAPLIELVWRELGRPLLSKAARPRWLICDAKDCQLALAANAFGFQTTALTPLEPVRAALETFSIDAWAMDMVLSDIHGDCQVLTLDALEQRPYPRLLLSRAAAVLKTGGLLHIPFNEFDAQAWRLMGQNQHNAFLQDPLSYHMFTRARLEQLLQDSGFAIKALATDPRSVVGLHLIAQKI